MTKERKAVYPGSFDPPTNGHKFVMGKVSSDYDLGFVAIGVNPDKKGRFSVSEREEMLNEIVINEFPNLVVTKYMGLYLVDFAEMMGAKDIVRGTRNGRDFEYESDIKHVNYTINPDVNTVVYIPDKEFLQVSSSVVMSLVGFEGWQQEVAKMVPVPVFKKIEKMQDQKDKENFLKSWKGFCERLGATKNVEQVFESLIRSYSEPQRKYHTLSHIKTCLSELDLVKDIAQDPDAIEMAIWFHDAIYRFKQKESDIIDNEEESAELAEKVLTEDLGLDPEFATKVRGLVLATKHDQFVEDFDQRLMADIDLAGFGRSRRIFKINNDLVRQEYSSVPTELFLEKRIEALVFFLPPKRKSVFQTEFFGERYEQKARENLQNSIKDLKIQLELEKILV
jgi:pantetheine-phosphate adenylyltransferase